MCASPKDLGVLLTCFYLGLEYNAWLMLGNSLTHGDSCFVLVKEGTEYFIVDPTNGKKYNSKNIYCPLSKVYCLVNESNVSL